MAIEVEWSAHGLILAHIGANTGYAFSSVGPTVWKNLPLASLIVQETVFAHLKTFVQ